MPAEIQQHRGKIVRPNAGIDQRSIKRRELFLVSFECITQRHALLKLRRNVANRLRQSAVMQILSDEPQPLLDRQTRSREMRQLLIERGEVFAGEWLGAHGTCRGVDAHDAQAQIRQRLEASSRSAASIVPVIAWPSKVCAV